MPYPDSPFSSNFDLNLITQLNNTCDKNDTTVQIQNVLILLKWLCTTPGCTTFRINSLKCSLKEGLEIIRKHTANLPGLCSIPYIGIHDAVEDVIVIKHCPDLMIPHYTEEIIVDVMCAAAVLRGAHIYVPGIIGMLTTTKIDDFVSIYADVSRKCKKGYQKLYEDNYKIFIGNGRAKVTRYELFVEKKVESGVAIEILQTVSGCPPIGDNFAPQGYMLLQNLPSIICVRVLDPKPGETVLDMCASPGNKTTHIAALMKNQGILVAIDKTPGKIKLLRSRCQEFGANPQIFLADSRKIVSTTDNNRVTEEGPPFQEEMFDRILLDAPCSVLGKRPQLSNSITESELKSYVPLQKSLFKNAVSLLKKNGVLVYSTCTITLSENENIVAWALKTFPNLKLVPADDSMGGPGWPGSTLTEEERQYVRRFGPDDKTDSVGFFIAKIIKSNR